MAAVSRWPEDPDVAKAAARLDGLNTVGGDEEGRPVSETDGEALSLAAALTREHHQIDAAIEQYLASVGTPPRRAVPLLQAMESLRRHIYLEEEILFPRLPAGPLMMPLMVMRREHGELWRRMDWLADRLRDPGTSDNGLESACSELLALLASHNSKEEPIVYPHLDADLGEDERAQVRELVAMGTLPEGWVCQDLR